MNHARTMNELRWMNEFYTLLGALTSMKEVYSDIVVVEGPLVVTDFD